MIENFGAPHTSPNRLTQLVTQISLNFYAVDDLIRLLSYWEAVSGSVNRQVDFVNKCVYGEDFLINVDYLTQATLYFATSDQLFLFYWKKLLVGIAASGSYTSNVSFIKVLSYKIHTSAIFTFVASKWGYAFFLFVLAFFFTNVNHLRYQYNFNFYFNYFKIVSDLGEQEYGSYDDFKFFLFFLVQILMWYCWVLFLGYTFTLESNSFLNILTLGIMVTILLIPVKLLWDFGLAFGVYIRGSGNSANLIVESIFDMLGIIIIFTRFVVQNIRFLLVFAAFFELFEWSSMSFNVSYFFSLFESSFTSIELLSHPTNVAVLLLNAVKLLGVYMYHLLHLIVISFMQIGVYMMVSFWLFFFLYTSFFKNTPEHYFSARR